MTEITETEVRNPYLIYEQEKAKLQALDLPPEQYDKAIIELLKKLNL